MQDSVTLEESRSVLQDVQPSSITDGIDAFDSVTRQLRKFVETPTSIAEEGGSDRDGWGCARRYFDADLTGRLIADRPGGVSVNVVLLSALHLAIGEWNDDHGKRSGTVSVMMPVNLRPDEWFYQVMAMYSTFESVETRRSDRRDPRRTIRKVADQTTAAKERDRAKALLRALELLPPGTPVGIKRQLPNVLRGPGRRLTDTALLTNLGNIPAYPSPGEDTEERARFSPPAWEATPVSFGVATIEGELNLFCRYTSSQFDGEGAEAFVDYYVDAIERLVDEELPAMTTD